MAALHVETFGTGTPVLLLHSSGLSGSQWKRLVPLLVEHGCRAIVPDLTGHGKSPPLVAPAPMSWRDDVARVVELLVEPTHLVGHSYGGLIALHAALAAPARVRSVIVYDPVAFGLLEPGRDDDALAQLAPVDRDPGASTVELDAWLEGFVEFWSGQGAWGALRPAARDEFRRVGWAVREGVCTLRTDHTKADSYATVPHLGLITGEHTPLAAQRVVERLGEATGAPITRIPNAGHMGPLSHPELVNARVLELLCE